MKKGIAIFFTCLYLFNLAGYKILFDYLILQVDQRTIQAIDDSDFNEDSLIELKVALQLPYSINQLQYERYDGEIEIKGIRYDFVKRKWNNDTLYVLCLPNTIKTDLHKGKDQYQANEITGNNNSPLKTDANPPIKKILVETAYNLYAVYELSLTEQIHKLDRNSFTPRLITSCFNSLFKPPKLQVDNLPAVV